ncbi:hypothetical protein BH23CHL7_BH23CHL7_15000 [soil metagenome]
MDHGSTSYGDIQHQLAQRCADAQRLAAEAQQQELRLRMARRERTAIERQLEDAALADPRTLAAAKSEAQHEYRRRIERAVEPVAVMRGAGAWLSEIDRLNRAAAAATGHAENLAQRMREAEVEIGRLGLSVRAAQVAAETANEACLEAGRVLARHDEASADTWSATQNETQPADAPPDTRMAPIEALLADDREAVADLVKRVSEEAGLESSRVLLLLLELREALVARAYEAAVLDFPHGHPFWGQFTRHEARSVAASLAVLGRGFDGRGGWQDGKPAEPREVAVALSLAGRDPRTTRHRAAREELDGLWRGVTVAAFEHLRETSPDLGLETITRLLGPRADGLSDLWDNWGRIRRLMLAG